MVIKRPTHSESTPSSTPSFTQGHAQSHGSHAHTRANANANANTHTSTHTNAHANTHTSTKAPSPRVPEGASTGAELLITRRNLLLGALGVGSLALLGGGAYIASGAGQEDGGEGGLEVPTDAVITSDDFEETSWEDHMGLVAEIELDYGSLVWCNDPDMAVCLLPTEGAKPLASIGIILPASGTCTTVVEQAIGQDDGFEIYDVRGTSSGIIWTEANILDNVWRIFAAPLTDFSLGEPLQLAEGGSDWETPTIAAVGNHAFWQVLPKSDGAQSDSPSRLFSVTFGSSTSSVWYASPGRMATAPYACDDALIITPRTSASSVYYQLTKLNAETGAIEDTMVLPSSMKPLDAGYGNNGFTFSFDALYDYGDGISNLGSYTPASAVTPKDPTSVEIKNASSKDPVVGTISEDGITVVPNTEQANTSAYSEASWFCFNRTPSAPSAWCDKFFIVKSISAVVGIDIDGKSYFSLDVANGADDYGEYLASTGSSYRVLTYSNIDYTSLSGNSQKYCRVRAYDVL